MDNIKRFIYDHYIIFVILFIVLISGIFGGYYYLNFENFLTPSKSEVNYKEEITFECGDKLPTINDFAPNYKGDGVIEYFLDNQKINLTTLEYDKTYVVKITLDNGKEFESILKIVDTTGPNVVINNVMTEQNVKYSASDFIESCIDNSNDECSYSFTDEAMGKYSQSGTYEIGLIIKDSKGNETRKTAQLIIKNTITKSEEDQQEFSKPSSTPKNEVKLVDSRTDSTSTDEYRYGVKITTTVSTKYNIYSDGSEKQVSKKNTITYDRSGYNATTSDLKTEAE